MGTVVACGITLAIVCRVVFLRALIIQGAVGRLFGLGGRVSGKTLPLCRHQALQLLRHDLSKVEAQSGARSRARPSRRAL
jgi:hypothetical protein